MPHSSAIQYHPSLSRLVKSLFLPVVLFVAAPAFAQTVKLTPYHDTGIYQLNETVGWNVTVPDGATPPTNHYSYTIKKNNQTVLKSGELDLSSGKASFEIAVDEPCMIYAQVVPPGGRGNRGGRGGRGGDGMTVGAAVAPTQIQPSVPKPADFDEFWAAKIKLLDSVPVNPVLTPVSNAPEGMEFDTIKLDSVGSHVQGYFAKPNKEGKFPAIVQFQYAGVYALDPKSVTDRAAKGWLAMDVDSHDILPTQGNGAPTGYQSVGNTNRESSYFLNMYLRDYRALQFLTSRPEWDGKTLVFYGLSMGGQQSLVMAGLFPKVTHVIIEVPSGADSNGPLHGRASGYPNWPSNNPKIMETALYFDTVNFAPRINATCLIAMGFIDTTSPPVGVWAAFNQIKGPKLAVPMIYANHNHLSTEEQQRGWNEGSARWLDSILKTGKVDIN